MQCVLSWLFLFFLAVCFVVVAAAAGGGAVVLKESISKQHFSSTIYVSGQPTCSLTQKKVCQFEQLALIL